jgi:bidirectional [NiFe] hydrogenase diaphorase subunit
VSTSTIKLKIDNQEVTVPEGTMILHASRALGINIPTLCYLDGLQGYGGCRLCMVEIHGSPKLFAACVTPVGMGMEVVTQSDKLKEYRKLALQIILAERTHICSVCVANNACELQKLANELGVDHSMFQREWSGNPVDSTHNFLVIDRNRCILCTRCIRVCDQVEGVHTLDLKLRGKDSQVIVDLDDQWATSKSCTSCRKCAKVCPVGAIYVEGESLADTKDEHIAEFVLKRRVR